MNTHEAQLWAEFRNGSQAARDQLLSEHLGLVYHVARQMIRSLTVPAEMDELVSAGTLGLIGALKGFDPGRGLAFSTYAAPRIRGAILDELRNQDSVPRSVREKVRDLSHAREALQHQLGRPPETDEIAEHLGVDIETIWKWEADAEHAVQLSLDQHANDQDTDDTSPSDRFAIDGADDMDEAISHEQEVELLAEAMLKLKEQERLVLTLYYHEGLNQHDIAKVLKLTESRISQIRAAGLSKLRKTLSPMRKAVV